MPRLAKLPAFTLAHGKAAMHRQIYDHFRTAIAVGQLKPGDRLPSARAFAQQLKVARGTVDAAYAMLACEGYVVSRRSLGTSVSQELSGAVMSRTHALRRSAPITERKERVVPNPFQLGLPALDAFPRKLWSS